MSTSHRATALPVALLAALAFCGTRPSHAGTRAWLELRTTSGEVSINTPLPNGDPLRLHGAGSGRALAIGGDFLPDWGVEISVAGYGRYRHETRAQAHAVALLGDFALSRTTSWLLRAGVQRSIVTLEARELDAPVRQDEYGALFGLGLRWRPYDAVSLTLGFNEHALSGGGLEFGVRAEFAY